MRDAFGGAFMLKLGIFFLVTYILIMAFALNYAKAFRVKNQVINILEQKQYTATNSISDNEAIEMIKTYVTSTKIVKPPENICKNMSDQTPGSKGYTYRDTVGDPLGVCIISIGDIGAGNFRSTRYYKVVTFITIDAGFLGLYMNIPVSGETKVIYG